MTTRAPAPLFALLVFVANPASATYYSITGGGAQFWSGFARPLPLMKLTTPGHPIPTGTMFPPLLIPVNPTPSKALIQQTAGPDPKQITVPPGAIYRKAPGPKAIGVKPWHPRLFQVRTNIAFSAPAHTLGPAVLKAGGRTGAPKASFSDGNGGWVFYTKTVAQFGGPLQARIAPASPIRGWVAFREPPCKHPAFGGMEASCLAALIAEYPDTLAPFGAPVGFTTMTPGTPAPMSPYIVAVSVPNSTGLIAKSAAAKNAGSVTDMASGVGLPWTTGRVRISEPSALAVPEQFTITGMDSRINGVGTISLVSGAVTRRTLSGPTANRGWLRLTVPEPSAVPVAIAALATLAGCHALTKGRRRK